MFSDIKKNKGFTMLEAVIATSIVAIGIIGLLIASQNAVLIIYDARNRLTATYLAKEGTEIVRNIRDRNWLRPPTAWNSGLTPGHYEAQFDSPTLMAWENRPLRVDAATGFFNYDPADPITKFTRKIIIENLPPIPGIPGVSRIRVTVEVRWHDQTLLLEENLYNWR